MKRFITLLGATFLVTACAGEQMTSVNSIQKRDKELSCTEVLLEMNEAEFHKNTAQSKKMPSLKNVVMPLGYMSTYMNSEDAIHAADARINYLNKIYEIMKCDDQQNQRYGNSGQDEENQMALANAEPMEEVTHERRAFRRAAQEEQELPEMQESYNNRHAAPQIRELPDAGEDYAAPVPYVQVNPASGRYTPANYGQPMPDMEQYLASAPYANGYTPIRRRYEERRNRDSQQYGYDYGSPSYEERIPEGAPIQSGY